MHECDQVLDLLRCADITSSALNLKHLRRIVLQASASFFEGINLKGYAFGKF